MTLGHISAEIWKIWDMESPLLWKKKLSGNFQHVLSIDAISFAKVFKRNKPKGYGKLFSKFLQYYWEVKKGTKGYGKHFFLNFYSTTTTLKLQKAQVSNTVQCLR